MLVILEADKATARKHGSQVVGLLRVDIDWESLTKAQQKELAFWRGYATYNWVPYIPSCHIGMLRHRPVIEGVTRETLIQVLQDLIASRKQMQAKQRLEKILEVADDENELSALRNNGILKYPPLPGPKKKFSFRKIAESQPQGKVAMTALEKRKTDQLSEAVERLGTQSQRGRWTVGVMSRAEAIYLIWKNVFHPLVKAGFRPLPARDLHLPVVAPDEREYTRVQVPGTLLTDSQWKKAERISAIMDGATCDFYTEKYDSVRIEKGDFDELSIMRIRKIVGEYVMACDIVLPTCKRANRRWLPYFITHW